MCRLVQQQIDRDAEVDLPALLKRSLDADAALTRILELLQHKVSYDDVDVKIEERYMEILLYLQQVLKATEGDDEDVRKETSDLRTALSEMRANKADRGDMVQLRAQLASQLGDATRGLSAEQVQAELLERPRRAEVFTLLRDKASYAEVKHIANQAAHRASSSEGDAYASPRRLAQSSSANHIDLVQHPQQQQRAGARSTRRDLGPERACASSRGYGDVWRPGSSPTQSSASLTGRIPGEHCLSCETLINANALRTKFKTRGGGFQVHAPLGQLQRKPELQSADDLALARLGPSAHAIRPLPTTTNPPIPPGYQPIIPTNVSTDIHHNLPLNLPPVAQP